MVSVGIAAQYCLGVCVLGLRDIETYSPSSRYCEQLLTQQAVTPCAHGGEREFGDIPNSLQSFRRAIEEGISCIEVDLSITRDDVLVAVHDRDLSLFLPDTSQPTHNLFSGDLLDAGVSTFEQIFDLISEYAIRVIIIDVKVSWKEKRGVLLDKLVSLLAQRGSSAKEVIVWGKDDQLMTMIHDGILPLDSNIKIGITVMDMPGKMDAFRVPSASYPRMNVVGQHWEFGTNQQVDALSKRKKRVFLWTSDTVYMMSKSLEQFPEAIVTSYPRTLRAMMDAWHRQCTDRIKDEL